MSQIALIRHVAIYRAIELLVTPSEYNFKEKNHEKPEYQFDD